MLRIAIQAKGRLNEQSIELLSEAGIRVAESKRKLISRAGGFPLEVLYLRDDDIPQAVAMGVADLGIVGLNEVAEKGFRVEQAMDLGFGNCRISLAVERTVAYEGLDYFRGKRVAVIGHFPFAAAAMPDAAQLNILERNVLDGDYPDPACEYLLPEMDYVFISGSAFVNKTMPRLLALAADAHTVVLGPSAPASPAILAAGATTVMSFASAHPARLEDGLAGRTLQGMYDAGMRVELSRP